MSLLSKLFGGGSGKTAEIEPEVYQGYRIYAEPMPEGGKFRLAARIEKDADSEVKTHQLIRADLLDSRDEAAKVSLAKARQVIDEQGDALFR